MTEITGMESKEQLSLNPATEEGADKNKENSFGKFKTKEALIEAYNSLEAEFTRRSQKIKELENGADKERGQQDDKWAVKVRELTEKYPVAKGLGEEIGEYLKGQKELLKEENCLETALLNVLAKGYQTSAVSKKAAPVRTESLDKENILNYLSALRTEVPAVAPPVGEIPAVLPLRPKTISEAGELAVKLLKNMK